MFQLEYSASSNLVAVPDLFENGPEALAAMKLESDEITSLMLLESVMDISSTAVLASSCHVIEGKSKKRCHPWGHEDHETSVH